MSMIIGEDFILDSRIHDLMYRYQMGYVALMAVSVGGKVKAMNVDHLARMVCWKEGAKDFYDVMNLLIEHDLIVVNEHGSSYITVEIKLPMHPIVRLDQR